MNTLEQQARQTHMPSLMSRAWNWLRKRRWVVLLVFVPTVVAGLYYGLVASDIYVSESRFVIKAPNQKQPQLSTIANLIQTTGLSTGQEQTNEILDYVRSRGALADLSRSVDVRGKFMSPAADLFSRYPAPFVSDRFENLFKYYGKMVSAELDHDTGVARLSVKAFSPDDARAINARLLSLSEDLVNKLNDRAQVRAISEAQHRVDTAETRVVAARVAMRQYRNEEALLDPAKQATGVLEVSNRLVAEQAALRAQLDAMQRVAPRNPAIATLRDRIAAIGAQIAAQDRRAVGGDNGLASKLTGYENLAVEQEFATQMLNAANANLEQARTEAQKQQFYLERVVEPNRPDLALLPHRIQQTLVVFAAALCLYLIGWMLIVGILEHSPED
jgi:capsular polysaccharide transport system permease protein